MIGYPADSYYDSVELVASQNGYLFFNARSSTDNGVGLYRSDGTLAGTQLYFAPDANIGANEWPEIVADTPGVIYIRSGIESPSTRLWAATISQKATYLPMVKK